MSPKPPDAQTTALKVLNILRATGHVALLAGGCVRDMLLRRVPKDYDIATDATPDYVLKLFPRARMVGAKFGVVLVRKYGHDVEVATFRSDGAYVDGRHPEAIRFGTQIEDARRRDFTINGLFFDPVEDRIIDYVDGRADLRAGLIRTIGDPAIRFGEDHLRMLRAVRFAAQLGFQIEPGTMAAIRHFGDRLRAISAERIWQELEAILTAPTRACGWALLIETGLRSHLNINWKADPDDDEIVRHRLRAMPGTMSTPVIALAAVWGSWQPEDIEEISKGLRLPNRLAKDVSWLVRSLRMLRHCRFLELADLKLLVAADPWRDLLELLRIDLLATGSTLHRFDQIGEWADAIPSGTLTPPPLLDGNDLQEMGFAKGPVLGRTLSELFRAQLNGLVSTREQAKRWVRSFGARDDQSW